jgi:hypothetical protein
MSDHSFYSWVIRELTRESSCSSLPLGVGGVGLVLLLDRRMIPPLCRGTWGQKDCDAKEQELRCHAPIGLNMRSASSNLTQSLHNCSRPNHLIQVQFQATYNHTEFSLASKFHCAIVLSSLYYCPSPSILFPGPEAVRPQPVVIA